MRGKLILALALAISVAGCGRVAESRFNPINWFGQSRTSETSAAQTQTAVPLVNQIITLRAEKVPGGAIVRATGLPQRQGYFDGQLVAENGGKPVEGVLSYRFTISAPYVQTASGPPRSREVVVGLFVSDQSLEGVRQIRVSAATNALVVRR
jgi:hypothetical protein